MPNPIHDPRYRIFREMLTKERLDKGWLQSDIADRLNKNQSFVSKYERGERRLDFAEFIELADVLGLNVADFTKRYKAEIKKLK